MYSLPHQDHCSNLLHRTPQEWMAGDHREDISEH